MKISEFPTKVWVLQPSFKPKQIELVGHYTHWQGQDYYHVLSGKPYHEGEVFPTKSEAIARGRERLSAQQADLDKKQANLNKRKAALDAAEAV